MAIRKVVCVQYETGKTVKVSKRTFPETKLLVVGSAFVDEKTGRINGTFRAVPPQWDGRFVILDPLPPRGAKAEGVVEEEIPL